MLFLLEEILVYYRFPDDTPYEIIFPVEDINLKFWSYNNAPRIGNGSPLFDDVLNILKVISPLLVPFTVSFGFGVLISINCPTVLMRPDLLHY